MGKVIHIADWLAARGTPPTAPAHQCIVFFHMPEIIIVQQALNAH